MSDESRVIKARGACVCGVAGPELRASEMIDGLLVAGCCGALYLDRGEFLSLIKQWREVPQVEGYDQPTQAERQAAAWARIDGMTNDECRMTNEGRAAV